MIAKSSSEPAWYCLKTQTKREAIAAAHLRELEGVEVFCPMLRYRKATRRGKVWWVEALFPGYLLARFRLSTDERAVMYSQGVRGLVRFGERCRKCRTISSRRCARKSPSKGKRRS